MSSDDTRNDFLFFDGNAAGYRVLCRTQNWRNEGGLRLCAAVVGAFVKYPYSSKVSAEMLSRGTTSKKKFGYFHQDLRHFSAVFDKLGMRKISEGHYARHPLVYLVEAADDICYHATDIEDGVRSGIIPKKEGVELLKACCNPDHIPNIGRFEAREDLNRLLAYLRSGVISTLVDECYLCFIQDNNYTAIMDGTFSGSLVEACSYAEAVRKIEVLCKNELYVHRAKMEVEAGGFQIIEFLLNEFGAALEEIKCAGVENISRKYKNLYYLLPKEIRGELGQGGASSYALACHLIDYIVGMSDKFAVDLFKKISGGGLIIGR